MSQVLILVQSVTFSSFSLISGEWTRELLGQHETWTVNVVVVHVKVNADPMAAETCPDKTLSLSRVGAQMALFMKVSRLLRQEEIPNGATKCKN